MAWQVTSPMHYCPQSESVHNDNFHCMTFVGGVVARWVCQAPLATSMELLPWHFTRRAPSSHLRQAPRVLDHDPILLEHLRLKVRVVVGPFHTREMEAGWCPQARS